MILRNIRRLRNTRLQNNLRSTTEFIQRLQCSTSTRLITQKKQFPIVFPLSVVGMVCAGYWILEEEMYTDSTHEFVLTKEEISMIAQLLNGVVDLPDVNESQEQEIFEHVTLAVFNELKNVLPVTYGTVMREKSQGISEEAQTMILQRLQTVLPGKIQFPFLDERNEKEIIYSIIVLFVECLEEGRCLSEVLKEGPQSHDFISIFIRGALGFLNDEDLSAMADKICDVVDIPVPIPLLPKIKQKLVGNLLEALADIVDEALQKTLIESFGPPHFNSTSQNVPVSYTPKKHTVLENILIRNTGIKHCQVQNRVPDLDFIGLLKFNITTMLNEMIDIPVLNETQEAVVFGRIVELWFDIVVNENKIKAAIATLHVQEK